MQGIRVGVRIGEQPSGKIAVDLRGDASAIAPFAKPLLLMILADTGASIKRLPVLDRPGREGRDLAGRPALDRRPAAAAERRRFARRKQRGAPACRKSAPATCRRSK